MGKSSDKKVWHICGNVIDPIAEELWNILGRWNKLGAEPPSPDEIERLYKKHDLEFAITWLKLNVSVAFANDFKQTIYDPLDRFRKLYFRCLQILDGDMDGVSKTATGHHRAIVTVMDNRYAELRITLPETELENFDPDEDPILGEIANWYGEVEFAFRDTVRYLKQTSVILRAKIDRQKLQQNEVKKTQNEQFEWSQADTPTRWAKVFGVSVDTFKRRVKDGLIRAHRLSDRSYQVDVRDLPKNDNKSA